MSNFNYGENLRTTRQFKGLSQESMAWELNISQTTYSRIERGIFVPDRRQAAILENILGVPLLELVPVLEDLENESMVATRGSGLSGKAAALLGSPAGFIIKIGLALALGGVAYDAARGACSALQTSSDTSIFASWIAALTMVSYFYYWADGVKELE